MDYAAPEVREGGAFSAASDVFALSLLLYRLLTGRRPFPLSGGEPTPPRELCPACPLGLERMLLTMLSPSPDSRPTLGVVQAALNDDLEDRDDAEAEAERPATGEHTAAAAIATDTVTAEPAAAFVSATDGAVTAVADTGSGRRDGADLAPDRRPREPGWWAVGLTAVACLAIGHATVPHDQPDPPTLLLPASLTEDEQPGPPKPSIRTVPAAPPLGTEPKRDEAPRAPRREAVTRAEASEAAQRAVPSLRTCTDVPRRVTADLDIVRGRGVVTALNGLGLELDDPKSWHGCAVQGLNHVWFPVSETTGHVQVRLTLR